MATKRAKKPVMEAKTIEQAEAALAEYAIVDAKVVNLTSKMDIEITKIREKYADDLQELTEKREEKFQTLQLFAQTNEQLFERRKSYVMAHGNIGFRTGTPKLKTLGKHTFGSALEMCKEYLPEYVRTVPELAKDRLIADRELEEVQRLMPKCGLQVVQDESFFVELKKEGE